MRSGCIQIVLDLVNPNGDHPADDTARTDATADASGSGSSSATTGSSAVLASVSPSHPDMSGDETSAAAAVLARVMSETPPDVLLDLLGLPREVLESRGQQPSIVAQVGGWVQGVGRVQPALL